MDATTLRSRLGLILFAACFLGFEIEAAPDQLPPTHQTLQALGRRLSQSWSARDLTAIASRAELLLSVLQARERSALARGYLRFRIDSPVVVYVAAPAGAIPFWVSDLGFMRRPIVLENPDTKWSVFRRSFPPGWIGLGVNGLDRTPVAHYVVFIKPRDRGQSATRQLSLELDERNAESWKPVPACAGASAAMDSHRPFDAIPAELAGAVLLQPAHSNRHGALLAAGRVWKTHVPSTPRPDQVAVAFGSDAARELVFTWRTSPEIESTAVRIARMEKNPRVRPAGGIGASGVDFRVVTGESTCLAVPDLMNDPVVRRHRVSVNQLEPDTVYRYSLGDGTPHGWEPWQFIKTAPDRSMGTRFLYLGDAQTGLEGWGRLLAGATARHPESDFIILAGDLVDRGNERTNWDHLFLRARGVFDRWPVMPCAGNHEYLDQGPRLYRAVFELPRNGPACLDPELVYQFECGDAFFAVLDSTLATCNADLARRQAGWLDAALKKTTASWKFVIFHHPVYPAHAWRDSPALRSHWVPVFDKYHVDFVLQGHDHAYQRTFPLRAHERVKQPSEGTIYLIAVSGDKFVQGASRPYVAVAQSGVSSYQTFDIDSRSKRLLYRAWNQSGRIIDELTVEKSSADLRLTRRESKERSRAETLP
jgi:hypothetical protein